MCKRLQLIYRVVGSIPLRRAGVLVWFVLPTLALLSGCNHLHHEQHEHVYVSAHQVYLHDRVAAVSNRVAQVQNGETLDVIDHGRRFLHVKTQTNQIGWIEEHAVIDQKLYDQFQQLAIDHKQDPTVATATVRDDVYLHIRPGRKSENFYMLAANAKVQLLARKTVPKTATNVVAPPGMQIKSTLQSASAKSSSEAAAPAPIPLEDWWLVRDASGHVGWMLASRVDVDVPDEIGIYAEGQRIVGAYVLARVMDPKSAMPDKPVPEYVTLLSPPKAGLPYDFDQVRVFTWSTNHHRYETAYRLHPIAGFFPLKITSQPVHAQASARHGSQTQQDSTSPQAPVFSFQIANATDLLSATASGLSRPTSLRTISYQMVDTRVSRIGPDLAPIPVGHLPEDQSKSGGKSALKKRRR